MTTERHQRRYDQRLQNLVQHAGDATIATDLGNPIADQNVRRVCDTIVRVRTICRKNSGDSSLES